ncbi:MAG: hypothetical protein LC624_09585 [Halobacteriales archaeon]|nr:hypothetical protein [Halobacteriales archaeon]
MRLPTSAEVRAWPYQLYGWLDESGGVEHLCYASGLLLVISGSAGNAASYLAATNFAGLAEAPILGRVVEGVRHILLFLATLGGTSVLIGGYLAEKRYNTFLCSIFVGLGCGLGLLGVASDLFGIAPNPVGVVSYLLSFTRGMAGVGTLLALIAQVRLLFPHKPRRAFGE